MENTTPSSSGGARTSRTMMLSELRQLLEAVGDTATTKHLKHAVLEDNVLGKNSTSSRQRSWRYLRELYSLDDAEPSFAALRKLWAHDREAQPLIALSSALVRDPALRGTAT